MNATLKKILVIALLIATIGFAGMVMIELARRVMQNLTTVITLVFVSVAVVVTIKMQLWRLLPTCWEILSQLGGESSSQSQPLSVLLQALSSEEMEAARASIEEWAQQEGITTIAQLGDDPESLERLNSLDGFDEETIPTIQNIWITDDQRLSRNRLVELSNVHTTIAWGGVLTLFLSIVFVLSQFFLSIVEGLGVVLLLAIGAGVMLWHDRQQLENEHVGIVQLGGRRIFSFPMLRHTLFVACEGIHFALEGILDFETVDLRLLPLAVAPVKGWSEDKDAIHVGGILNIAGEEVDVGAVVQYLVVDVVRFTSMAKEEILGKAFPARIAEVIRAELRGLSTEDVLSGRKMEQALSNAVEIGVNLAAWEWGIRITNDGVFIPSIDVDPDIRSAMEAKAADKRYREAQEEFMEAFGNIEGVGGDELLRHFRIHRKETSEEVNRNINTLGVDSATLTGFAALLQALRKSD